MKSYFLAALGSLGLLTTQVNANVCRYKEVPSTGKTYVVPLYKANVNFVFNKEDENAFAQVFWSLDEVETKKCFKEGQDKFPTSKLVIPRVQISELTVHVLGGMNPTALHVVQEATGHWNGMADLIKIPFSSRSELEMAIKQNRPVIQINGELAYRMLEVERKVIGKVECIEKSEEAGVLNMFRRFGEIKNILEKRNQSEGIHIEEAMQEFLGTCVLFQDVDSNGLVEFNRAQRLNSRIVSGNLYFKGNVERESTVPIPTIAVQNASILDI